VLVVVSTRTMLLSSSLAATSRTILSWIGSIWLSGLLPHMRKGLISTAPTKQQQRGLFQRVRCCLLGCRGRRRHLSGCPVRGSLQTAAGPQLLAAWLARSQWAPCRPL
jgi:hypothetical protein